MVFNKIKCLLHFLCAYSEPSWDSGQPCSCVLPFSVLAGSTETSLLSPRTRSPPHLLSWLPKSVGRGWAGPSVPATVAAQQSQEGPDTAYQTVVLSLLATPPPWPSAYHAGSAHVPRPSLPAFTQGLLTRLDHASSQGHTALLMGKYGGRPQVKEG